MHIYSGILSDILSGIDFDILSGILSGIYSDILSGIYSDILSDILFVVLSGTHSDILSDVLAEVQLWSSRLRSSSAHCNLALAVEVRQCRLRSDARGWGPAVPTDLWSSRLRTKRRRAEEEKRRRGGGKVCDRISRPSPGRRWKNPWSIPANSGTHAWSAIYAHKKDIYYVPCFNISDI